MTIEEIKALRKKNIAEIKATVPVRAYGFIARALKRKALSPTQHYKMFGSPRDPKHPCTP